MLVIIYGFPGAGKTFAGRILAKEFGFHFWDGDNAIPQSMIDCIAQQEQMTLEMVNLLTENLIKNIRVLKHVVGVKPIVVSQALFIKSNREAIAAAFPDTIFIHLQSDNEFLLERLNKRGGYDEEYLMSISKDFEPSEYTPKNIPVFNNANREQLIENLSVALGIQQRQFMHDLSPAESYPIRYVKGDGIFFSVNIEEVDVKPNLNEWVDKLSLDRHDDLCVCIVNETNEAYLYFRNNTIQVIVGNSRDDLMTQIERSATKHRNKLKEDVLTARNNSGWIMQYYTKFFHTNALFKSLDPTINFSTHLIKTIYSNRKPLQCKTFIRGALFQQRNSASVPTILYFPGTGYTRELSEPCQKIAYKIALYTGCNVFMVDYRLAPEKCYPQALLDAVSAYEYLSSNSETMNIDPKKIIISGYSAGATLAIQLALVVSAIDTYIPAASLILIGPTLDFTYLNTEEDDFGKADRFMTSHFFRSNHSLYLQRFKQDLQNANISPLYMTREAMQRLPKTLLFQLGNDLLLPQHKRFAEMAKRNGVNLDVISLPDLDHISWWDNQLPMLHMSAWVRKTHSVSIHLFQNDNSEIILAHFPVSRYSATDSLPFSKLEPEQKLQVDDFYRNFLLQRDQLGLVLANADQYPDCIPLQIYAAMVHILSQTAQGIKAGQRYFDRLEASFAHCEREKLLIAAINYGRDNCLHEAIAQYTEVLIRWPDDLLAGLMIEFHCFEAGCPEKQLSAWENIREHYFDGNKVKDHPLVGHFLAHYAYAYELVGQPAKTLAYGGQALCINPFNPWAQHALAHALSNLKAPQLGIEVLTLYKDTWSNYGDFVRGHNYFHLALLYLQNSDFDNAFNLYHSHIKRSTPDMVYQQTDMIVFLWAANLITDLPVAFKKLIDDELNALYIHITKTNANLFEAKHLFPFLSLTYLYLCLHTNHFDKIKAIKEQIPSEDGKQIAEGLIQFSQKNYKAAYKALKRTYALMNIGGSDEQRSVIHMTYQHAQEQYIQEKLKEASASGDSPRRGFK